MSFLTKFSLKNAVAIFVVAFLLIIGGIYSFSKLKMDMLPDMNVPALVVQVINPGATATDMEEQVNKLIEPQIKGMESLDTYQTTSVDNATFYILQFKYGTDMEQREKQMKDAIDKLKLPENATTEVMRFTMGSIPIMNATLKAKGNHDVQKLVREEINQELSHVQGINKVEYFGQVKEVVDIQLNEEKSMMMGITMQQIQDEIEKNQMGYPVGVIKENDVNMPIRMEKSAEELKDLELKTQAGSVKLSDVATIQEADRNAEYGRFNGKDVVALTITKTQNGNTVEVTDEILKVLKSHKDELSYHIIFDQADSIKMSVKTLVKEGLFGALFASVTILLFLRSVRATIISIVSIPLSLLITAIFLNRLGITLNMMTLGAMAVAVGRVVDDSIVVIENIYRRIKQKKEDDTKDDLIISSTKEILGAITSSTITTAVVFLPIGLVGGMSGEIFLPFALTVVIALFASLFVAVTLVPILAKISFKESKHEEKTGKMEKVYASIIKKALNHKVIVLVVSILLLVGSFSIVPKLGFTLIPNDKQKMLNANITLASATPIEKTNEISKTIEKGLGNNKNVKDTTVLIGLNAMGLGGTQENAASYFINLTSKADVDKEIVEIKKEMEKTLPKGSEVSVQSMTNGSMPSGSAITIDLYNDNLDELQKDAKQVVEFVKDQKGIKSAESNFDERKEQYVINLNNEALKEFGVQPEVAMGLVASQLRNVSFEYQTKDGKTQNIQISYNKTAVSKQDIEKMIVIGGKGPIPLSTVASVEKKGTFTNIQKLDGKIYAQVSAETTSENIKKATDDVQKAIKEKVKLSNNTKLVVGGGSEQAMEAFGQMGIAMLVAVGLVYLTMLITFGKARIPFIILSSLIFVPIGALGALLITGEPLSISVMIGVLMLIGIVTTNAIVFVDRVGQNIDKKGMLIRDALIEAGKTRLRPILMTAFATVTALLPLGLSTASGTLISKGLAIVVIGGLTTSTLLTLIVIPVIYELFFFKKVRKELKAEK